MNNHLQFIFELRARLAGITAAVDRVREFSRSVERVRAVTRVAGADMARQFGGAALAARGLSYALAGVGAARGGFAALASGAARARAEMAALSSSVFNLRNLLIAGTAGYGAKLVIDAVSFKENTLIAFQTLLGSREEAERMMREAVRFAAGTPFETRDVIDAYQRLLTDRFKPAEIPVVLKAVGDLAALKGFSKEIIDRALRAIGQIRAKQRLQGEELDQLAEAGVSRGKVYEVLGRRLGVTAEQARKLQEAGRISADLGVVAVLETIRDTISGGQLGKLMDLTSRSISGLWSTLRSRPTELLMDINVDPVRNVLANLVALTDPDTPSRTGQRLKAMLERYIGGAFRAVFGSLAEATDPKAAEANLMRLLDQVEAFAGEVKKAWDSIAPALREVWAGIGDGLRVVRGLYEAVRPVTDALARVFAPASTGATEASASTWRLVGVGIALMGVFRLLNLFTLGLMGNVLRFGATSVLWFGRATIAAIRYAAARRGTIAASAQASMGRLGRVVGVGPRFIGWAARAVPWLLRLAGPWGLVASVAIGAVTLIIRNWDKIRGFFANLWASVSGAASAVWQRVVAWASGAWSSVVAAVSGAWGRITEAVSNAWAALRERVSSVAGGVRTALSSLYQRVVEWFRSLPGRIVEAVRGAGSRFVEGLREIVRRAPGGDLLLRALDAAGNVARQAWEWGKGVARAVGGGAREGLGIRSPSRVFAHIGAMTALGLAVGLQDAAPMVERATQTLLQATQVAPTIEAAIRLPEVDIPRPPRAPEVVGLKVVPTLRSPEAPPPPPAPLLPVVTALAPTTRETVVHIHVNGAQDPREVAREVVAAIDHWAAGRIVVLGLEALASEVGHDA